MRPLTEIVDFVTQGMKEKLERELAEFQAKQAADEQADKDLDLSRPDRFETT